MEIIDQFEEVKTGDFGGAVKFLTDSVSCVDSLRALLRSQVKPENFTQVLFEWLYKCIRLKERSNDLFTFVLQFSPDLLLVYLHAVYESNSKGQKVFQSSPGAKLIFSLCENQCIRCLQVLVQEIIDDSELKAMSEAPLLGLLMEVEKEKPPLIQVPTLSKASVYHKTTVQLAQSGLTEANLLRHNQTEHAPSRGAFTGKIITVNNRLHFLSTVMSLFADHIASFCIESKVAFCEACIILGIQGMGPFFTSQITELNGTSLNIEKLSSLRRYSISDSLVTSLLRGVRMCLFKGCHSVAIDALRVLRLRAEYELLTTAIQVSHALTRLTERVEPGEVPLDVQKQSCYHGDGRAQFVNDPSKVHCVLNSHILHCELSTLTPNPSDSSVDTIKISRSTDV